jgi:hypothetical protein
MKGLGRLALTALAVLAVSALAFAGENGMAQGKVTGVSEKTVTVAGDNGEVWTFEIAQGARVYARGASHKSRMLVSSGRKTTMDEFVQEGHYVTVHYKEKDGTRYITSLRVS